MLPIWARRSGVPGPWSLGPAGIGRERAGNAEHNLDLVVVDLDAAHDGADDLTATVPIQPVEAGVDPLRKLLQAPDYQVQAALSLVCGGRRIPFGAQTREPLLQAGQARPELIGADLDFPGLRGHRVGDDQAAVCSICSGVV